MTNTLIISNKPILKNSYDGAGNSILTLYSGKPGGHSLSLLSLQKLNGLECHPIFDEVYAPRTKYFQIIELAYLILYLSVNKHFTYVHVLSAYTKTTLACLPFYFLKHKIIVKITSSLSEVSVTSNISFRKWFRLQLLKRYSYVIAISDEIESACLSHGLTREQIIRLPNAVNLAVFYPEEQVRNEDNCLRLLFSGAVIERKGLHILLKAIARLQAQSEVQKIVLKIAGPIYYDDYYDTCKTIINGFPDCIDVEWLGFVSPIKNAIDWCDCLVLPSANEGMANAILEGLACGKPFIGTYASGMTELATKGAGILSERTVDGVTNAISQFHANKNNVRWKETALSTIKGKYDTDTVYNALMNLVKK